MTLAIAPDPERWGRIKSIFQAALDQPREARAAFVADACGGDDELQREVCSLLAHALAEAFLEVPARAPDTLAGLGAADPMVGEVLGPYRILDLIGHGGMGAVYKAARTDDVYAKAVALKLVKRGMDTEFILRRFRAERQILAQLDHPNIARLLDGGTSPDGRPYFVMEYIDGLPLDRYAETHVLDTRQRLRLFLEACAAVRHAHQALVVHRDLKPANILVTAEGRLKLLDFGIAKLLDPESAGDRTRTEARMMTPDYATPEQVRGEAITTATDVYALGVVLYELLAGARPYRVTGATQEELVDTICNEVPPPPSRQVEDPRRRRALVGELDNIVLMALRKEPVRRYASVEQLADDIERHLDGRTVRAQKDTLAYRAAKFLRRNRLAAGVAALVAATLVGGIAATSWQARVARAERARAERRFQDVRRLANTLLFDVHDEIRDLPGSTKARQRLVTEALRYLDGLAGEAQGDLELQRELATAYRKVGDVQGRPGVANLGDQAGAMASYRKALALYPPLVAAAPRDADLQADRVICLFVLGQLQSQAGDDEAAAATMNEGLEAALAASALAPADARLQAFVLNGRAQLGNVHYRRGDPASAIPLLRAAIADGKAACAAHPDDKMLRRAFTTAHHLLARALRGSKDFEAARAAYGEVRAMTAELVAAEPLSTMHRRDVALADYEIGRIEVELARWPEAAVAARRASAAMQALVAADPENADARRMLLLADGVHCRGASRATGRVASICADVRARAEANAAARPEDVEAQDDRLETQGMMGEVALHSGDLVAALAAYRRQLALADVQARARPDDPWPRMLVAQAQEGIGRALVAKGQAASALSAFAVAAEIREPAARDGDPDAVLGLIDVYSAMGDAHAGRQAWAEAVAAYRKALVLAGAPGARGLFPGALAARGDAARRGIAENESRLKH